MYKHSFIEITYTQQHTRNIYGCDFTGTGLWITRLGGISTSELPWIMREKDDCERASSVANGLTGTAAAKGESSETDGESVGLPAFFSS